MQPEDDHDSLEDAKKLDRFLDGKEQTTLYLELEKRGWAPDLSDSLTDEEVLQSLTNLIWSMKDLGHYIEDVDHLSDRELYAELLTYCDEPTVVYPNNPHAGMHWSPIGEWNDDDLQIWGRYYATEEQRERHIRDFPKHPLPPTEPIPYPRPWIPKQRFPFEHQPDEDEE